MHVCVFGTAWTAQNSPPFFYIYLPTGSVADPDPGSGAFLTPGSRIRNRFFPDPGSRIPDPRSQTHIFESLVTIFWGKKFCNSLKIGQNFFFSTKTKIMYNFVKFVATLKGMTTNFFHPSLLLLFLDPESEIRDPGSGMGKNQDPGSATLPTGVHQLSIYLSVFLSIYF